jgi:hypothetical protein
MADEQNRQQDQQQSRQQRSGPFQRSTMYNLTIGVIAFLFAFAQFQMQHWWLTSAFALFGVMYLFQIAAARYAPGILKPGSLLLAVPAIILAIIGFVVQLWPPAS